MRAETGTQAEPSAGRLRRDRFALGACAVLLVGIGLACLGRGVLERTIAEPFGTVPAEIDAGALAELRTSTVVEVGPAARRAGATLRAVGRASVGSGVGLLWTLAVFGGRFFGEGRRGTRALAALLASGALVAAVLLALRVEAAPTAAEAQRTLQVLGAAVLVPTLLAAFGRQ